MRSLGLTLVALTLAGALGATEAGSPKDGDGAGWDRFRGGPAQRGVATDPLAETLELAWTAEVAEGIESTAAIHHGTVYVGGLDGGLYAFDLATGKQRWRYSTGERGDEIKSSPLVARVKGLAGATVYVGDEGGVMHAVAAADGKARWTFRADSSITGSANLADGCLVFGSYDNFLYCLDAADGTLRWKIETFGYIHGTPAIDGAGKAISSGCDGYLRAIDLATGKEVAEIEAGGYVSASPAIGTVSGTSDGKGAGEREIVYFGSMDNNVLAIDLAAGKPLWDYRPEREFPFYSSPALAAGLVIVGGRDKGVHAIDAATGELRWRHARRARVDASPVIASSGDRVFVADKAGTVFALALADGSLRWEYETGDGFTASPSVGEGYLVIGNEAGILHAFTGARR